MKTNTAGNHLGHWRPQGLAFFFLVLVPVCQNMPDTRAVGELEDLEILPCYFEGLCRDIENIFPNQLAEVNRSLLDLLEQEAAERLHLFLARVSLSKREHA